MLTLRISHGCALLLVGGKVPTLAGPIQNRKPARPISAHQQERFAGLVSTGRTVRLSPGLGDIASQVALDQGGVSTS